MCVHIAEEILTRERGRDSLLCRNAVKPPTPSMLLACTALESCPNDMNLKHELLDKLVRLSV